MMKIFKRLSFLPFFLLLISWQAHATTYKELTNQVDMFKKSGQARFAPATMKKVTAYLGASMLAHEKQSSGFTETTSENKESQALQEAINQTLQVLAEAKNNAKSFTSSFPELLELEIEANKAYVYHHPPRVLPEVEISKHFDTANQWLNTAIIESEKGQLNQATSAAKNATDAFEACIDASMPGLLEETEKAMEHASSLGARNYAPRLWRVVEAEYDLLEKYHDNLLRPQDERDNIQRPSKIGYAYEMSIYAQKMAIQVKDWRRDTGSHEKLALAAQQLRIDIAKALELPLDFDEVGIDVEAPLLLDQVKSLQKTLTKERREHKAQLAQLTKDYEQQLQVQLQMQRLEDQQAFQSKVATIKDAFNTKLEQETFETKRQRKVSDLFQPEEANIIPNLDGSLIIRAKKIQFAPSSNKVASEYFEFLGRIKEVLEMYPDRMVKIEGHTDSIGDEKVNRKLSLQRAESVLEFLIAAGIDGSRLRALGFGEVRPIASNTYKKGRAMNRRIDIIIGAPTNG